MNFFESPYLYYVSIVLQAICAIHCVRKGTQTKWLWMIVFLPYVGCIIYVFTEMISRRKIDNVQSGVKNVIGSIGRTKKLEEQLRFADTFNNRIVLADAYLDAGMTEKAVALYESSLTGAFAENEHGIMQLMLAYYELSRYEDLVKLGKKIYKQPQFARSRAHLYYALAFEKIGNNQAAEDEFKLICGRFANYENRYEYGLFLARQKRAEEAENIFNAILLEKNHLTGRERSMNRKWFALSKDALGKLHALA